MQWSGGANALMRGSGTTTIAEGATAEIAGGSLGDDRLFLNRGTTTFTSDLQGAGGRFVNEGLVLLDGDVGFEPIGAGTLVNTETGVIRKIAGTGATGSWLSLLTNRGLLAVETGLLTIRNNSATEPLVQSGAFQIAGGATLTLTNGPFVFAAPTSVSRDGALRVDYRLRLDVDLVLKGLFVRGTIDGAGLVAIRRWHMHASSSKPSKAT